MRSWAMQLPSAIIQEHLSRSFKAVSLSFVRGFCPRFPCGFLVFPCFCSFLLRFRLYQTPEHHGGSIARPGPGHHRGMTSMFCQICTFNLDQFGRSWQVMVSESVCAKERMEAREVPLYVAIVCRCVPLYAIVMKQDGCLHLLAWFTNVYDALREACIVLPRWRKRTKNLKRAKSTSRPRDASRFSRMVVV